MDIKPIIWNGELLEVLNQKLLPFEMVYEKCYSYLDIANSIKEMKLRGAPVIGVAAAYGFFLGIKDLIKLNKLYDYESVKKILINSRPTAVNLLWAINKMENALKEVINENSKDILKFLEDKAKNIEKEEEEKCIKISEIGEKIIKDNDTILTHCNTGSLATLGPGTALGIIKYAHRKNKKIKVFFTETRPYLQGARLTSFELINEGIDSTMITDSMVGYILKSKKVNLIIVGADRIALNGDTANKIGTYTISVLAKENNVPFYIAAPSSTIDINIESGEKIPIEERPKNEVIYIKDVKISLDEIKVFNPSFDVTPNEYIDGIITEKGIIKKPYIENILKLFESWIYNNSYRTWINKFYIHHFSKNTLFNIKTFFY